MTELHPDRRVFLGSAALSLGGLSLTACASAPRRPPLGERRLLDRPGPVVPPVPAVLLSVRGDDAVRDELSVVWTFVLEGDPPQVGISVHDKHVAGGFVRRHRTFVLNLPTADMVVPFDIVDMSSHGTGDKFAASKLTRTRATTVDAPAVDESPVWVECRVAQEMRLPPARTLFVGEVVATAVRDGAFTADGRLDVAAVPFFGMVAGSGEFYTMGERVGHIGQTAGRDDIRY